MLDKIRKYLFVNHFESLARFRWFRMLIGGPWVKKAYNTGRTEWDYQLNIEPEKYKIIKVNIFPDTKYNRMHPWWREVVWLRHAGDVKKPYKEGKSPNHKLLCHHCGIDFNTDGEDIMNLKLQHE